MSDETQVMLDRETSDAFADLEAHVFSIGTTVIEIMASGKDTKSAIEEMVIRSGESFEFVRSATIDTLQREIGVQKK